MSTKRASPAPILKYFREKEPGVLECNIKYEREEELVCGQTIKVSDPGSKNKGTYIVQLTSFITITCYIIISITINQ